MTPSANAYRIASTYWVTPKHVQELLDFAEGDEQQVRALLDACSPLGRVPTAYGLRQFKEHLAKPCRHAE